MRAKLLTAQLDPLESLPLLALGRMQWQHPKPLGFARDKLVEGAQGQQNDALESFRAVVEATPGWGEAHTALGNGLLASGDRDGAAEHYRLAQIADGDLCEGVLYDFAAHLAEAGIQSPGADHIRAERLFHHRRRPAAGVVRPPRFPCLLPPLSSSFPPDFGGACPELGEGD